MIPLDGALAGIRTDAITLIGRMADALNASDDSTQIDQKRLRDIAEDLREMFFIVAVIGEFNSGKSTFINALLGERLLPMGITPTTEYIELIRWGEQPTYKPTMRPDGIRQWTHPNTGGVGIAIVDTPGTGSVFEKHEKTAKTFLHRSDLVIFVMNAKQAFAENERIYLALVQQYAKKVIIVLNQTDLLAPNELAEVRRFVETQLKDKLNLEPLIFTVSAKLALENPQAESGLSAIRAHLRGVYSDTPPAQQKLLAELETVDKIIATHIARAQQKLELVHTDEGKVRGVERDLTQQSDYLTRELDEVMAEVKRTLDGVRKRGHAFIDEHLRIKLSGRLSKPQLEEAFNNVVIGRAARDLEEIGKRYMNSVVDQSRLYWNNALERLNKLQELLEQQKMSLDASWYEEQRANLERAVQTAQSELQANISGNVLSELSDIFESNFGTFRNTALFTLGGVITTVVAIATPHGVTAFPLVLPALVVGGAVTAIFGPAAVMAYRRMTKASHDDFDQRVDRLLNTYNETLSDITYKERTRLTRYSKQQLDPIYTRLTTLVSEYQAQHDTLVELQRENTRLRNNLAAL